MNPNPDTPAPKPAHDSNAEAAKRLREEAAKLERATTFIGRVSAYDDDSDRRAYAAEVKRLRKFATDLCEGAEALELAEAVNWYFITNYATVHDPHNGRGWRVMARGLCVGEGKTPAEAILTAASTVAGKDAK